VAAQDDVFRTDRNSRSGPVIIFAKTDRFCRLYPDDPEQQQPTAQADDGQEVTKTAAAGDTQTTNNNDNRPSGQQQVTTPAPSNCYGQWSTPRGCNVTAGLCEYHVVWTYSSKTDYMRFTITTKHTGTWTGIGFSDDHRMVMTNQRSCDYTDRFSSRAHLHFTPILFIYARYRQYG